MFITIMSVSPDEIKELSPTVDTARIARKTEQEIELLCRQINRPIFKGDRPFIGIDNQLSRPDDRRICFFRGMT
jgi:hypothetical protein